MSYRFFFKPAFLICFWSILGCGYSFQNSRSPLLLKEGIRRVYVAPLVNNTYKPGIENVVFNELLRALNSQGRMIVVQNQTDADATLIGTVTVAGYAPSGSGITGIENLSPLGVGSKLTSAHGPGFPGGLGIATEYLASLNCSFTLTGKLLGEFEPAKKEGTKTLMDKPSVRKRQYVWSASFARSKLFPGANQLDVPGTTSPLINDSEFDRALADLAHSMMADVNESMLAMF